jgi:hypothetical protein
MNKVHLNPAGIGQVLRSREVADAVAKLAEQVADNARAIVPDVEGVPGEVPLPIEVSTYETDRARASVWLAHPAGLATQAKHGTLTKAASELGLEVNG